MDHVVDPRSLLPGEDGEGDIVTNNAAFVHGELLQDGNGPPKVDSEVEVLQEKVTKQIIKEGHDEKPSKYSTCFVHYRAWTESTQHKFEDTWQEQRPFELVLGKEKKEMEDLGVGVSNMKAGEHALLHGKAPSDMTVEERIGSADRRRMDGNALFKEEKLDEAIQYYEMAKTYMGDDFLFQLFGKYRDMAMAVQNPCHLNMAACLIKLKRYEDAIMQCSLVLAEGENNVKALYRRGKARAELGQTEAAREDLVKARTYAPDDKAVVGPAHLWVPKKTAGRKTEKRRKWREESSLNFVFWEQL